jgi:type I restriction enzyme S subunit
MADPMLNRHSREDGNLDSTSSESLITQHIDIWTTAIEQKSSAGRGSSNKFSLYGIKKLRELILELAVRGKLVPQDVNDEPAVVLLERIAAEKALLVKEGKIKEPKALPEIRDDEKPFMLPVNWSFLRLENMCELITKGSSPKWQGVSYTDNPDDVLFVTSENVGAFKLLLDKRKYVERKFNEIEPRSILSKNDFLMNIVGASIGRCAIFELNEVANINQAVCLIRSFPKHIVPEFFLKFFNSHTCISYMYDKQVENARPNLSMGNIAKFIIPIPPLEEQHRIVAKVDELMSLCDALEAQTEASITAHQTLVETLLNALLLPNTTQPADSRSASPEPALNDSFIERWQRVAEHFNTLFTTEASIDTLKQTILQLAVMGKLVEQASCEARNSPNYEPAAKLLERIAKEKAQLIKDGKIKKQKPQPAITDEEKPFELPKGWEWCKIQNITSKVTDGDHNTPPRIDSGYRLLSAKNVRDGHLDFESVDFIAEFDYLKSRERCSPQTGDLLIVSVGGTIGRSSLVPEDSNFALVRSVALLKPLLFCSEYLKYSMDSQLLQDSIHQNKRGGAQPCLYLSEISKFAFPMPPLEEQHRIVARVDELMTLCDQLKARLSDAQTTQLHLTDTIVEQAV